MFAWGHGKLLSIVNCYCNPPPPKKKKSGVRYCVQVSRESTVSHRASRILVTRHCRHGFRNWRFKKLFVGRPRDRLPVCSRNDFERNLTAGSVRVYWRKERRRKKHFDTSVTWAHFAFYTSTTTQQTAVGYIAIRRVKSKKIRSIFICPCYAGTRIRVPAMLNYDIRVCRTLTNRHRTRVYDFFFGELKEGVRGRI